MKTVLRLAAAVAVSLMVLLAFNWQEATNLYHTVTLFNADKIVYNFVNMHKVTPTIEVVSTALF